MNSDGTIAWYGHSNQTYWNPSVSISIPEGSVATGVACAATYMGVSWGPRYFPCLAKSSRLGAQLLCGSDSSVTGTVCCSCAGVDRDTLAACVDDVATPAPVGVVRQIFVLPCQ
jgi:hypothetical protein